MAVYPLSREALSRRMALCSMLCFSKVMYSSSESASSSAEGSPCRYNRAVTIEPLQ